jgi:L-fuconolactonase
MADPIVDSQVHVWAQPTEARPWAPGGDRYGQGVGNLSAADRPPLGPDELLREMDAAGVDRAIIVPPAFTGEDNSFALEAAQDHPTRFAVMGRISLPDPGSAARLPTWLDSPGMLGVRLTFHWGEQQRWLHDGTADWFWPLAQEHGIPVAAYAPRALDRLREVARAHPGLRLIVDHFGLPLEARADDIGPVVDELVTLSEFPNVAVKASALPSYVEEPAPFPTLVPHLRRVIEAFGANRVFWGSELSRLACTYAEVLALFTDGLPFLADSERACVLGRGICTWTGWAMEEPLTTTA